ncbi:hypothetical protein HYU23_01155 [Candidatus Woesearchaeota archaeon]|nr:hypothetical protein [Candidatus Woesearchaeota archaeon]
MKFILSKKDIIGLNQQFDIGKLHNEASLDFALSYAKNSNNWVKSLAYLTRAILIDHVFEEGNKRTVALLIKTYVELEGYKIYNDKIVKLVTEIILRNLTSIKRIEGMIENAIK